MAVDKALPLGQSQLRRQARPPIRGCPTRHALHSSRQQINLDPSKLSFLGASADPPMASMAGPGWEGNWNWNWSVAWQAAKDNGSQQIQDPSFLNWTRFLICGGWRSMCSRMRMRMRIRTRMRISRSVSMSSGSVSPIPGDRLRRDHDEPHNSMGSST